MSTLAKTKRPAHVVNPSSLLEIKALAVFNVEDLLVEVTRLCEGHFNRPRYGIYSPDSISPIINSGQVLYTHPNTYNFFPEVSSGFFDPATGSTKPVAQRINWREAIENMINVYDQEGHLLIEKSNDRSAFLFNPSAAIYGKSLTHALVESMVLQNTHWGNPKQSFTKLEEAIIDGGMENTTSFRLKLESIQLVFDNIGAKVMQSVLDFVRQEPWAIYNVSIISGMLFLQRSCDYRHYYANEELWNKYVQETDNFKQSNINLTYKRETIPLFNVEDNQELFNIVGNVIGLNITDMPTLINALNDFDKVNVGYKHEIMREIHTFLKNKKATKKPIVVLK